MRTRIKTSVIRMELLSQILTVKEIDLVSTKINNKWIKVKNKIFEKVSRIFAVSEQNRIELTLDINSEIYTLHEHDRVELKIVRVESIGNKTNQKNENWLDLFDRNLIDVFEYVMYGTIFHCGTDENNFFMYGSFGGLLIKIFGNLNVIQNNNFAIDSKILLLMRKL